MNIEELSEQLFPETKIYHFIDEHGIHLIITSPFGVLMYKGNYHPNTQINARFNQIIDEKMYSMYYRYSFPETVEILAIE